MKKLNKNRKGNMDFKNNITIEKHVRFFIKSLWIIETIKQRKRTVKNVGFFRAI